MELDEADEEIKSMGLLFSSTMIEGTYFLPDFAKWLSRNSRTQVYADLRRIIQASAMAQSRLRPPALVAGDAW